MISSTIPSAKYSCSAPLMNGSTAMKGLSGSGGAALSLSVSGLCAPARTGSADRLRDVLELLLAAILEANF